MRRVLLDGWALVHAPASPAALHTWALLAWSPPEIELYLALPGERPGWLPEDVPSVQLMTEKTPTGRLAWEQSRLPRLGSSLKADWLHTCHQSAPLFSRLPCSHSPAYYPELRHAHNFAERIRQAAGQGGLNPAQALLWPVDLPEAASRSIACPPFVHPEFTAPVGIENGELIELPETFVLYHGPYHDASLRRLLAAWGWASGPIGDYYPLLLLGLGAASQELAKRLIEEYKAAGSVQVLPELPTPAIPAIYRRCTALFHPAEIAPWGDAVLAALACGRPIAAAATPLTSARTGPAAYLAPLDDPRALGAALITLVVEEGMADSLAQAARLRASEWNAAEIPAALSALWKD